jgi:hypothetical protein
MSAISIATTTGSRIPVPSGFLRRARRFSLLDELSAPAFMTVATHALTDEGLIADPLVFDVGSDVNVLEGFRQPFRATMNR